jgi:hypothetical protein
MSSPNKVTQCWALTGLMKTPLNFNWTWPVNKQAYLRRELWNTSYSEFRGRSLNKTCRICDIGDTWLELFLSLQTVPCATLLQKCTLHITVVPITWRVQRNLGWRTTLISNKSVPEQANWQPGTWDVRRETVGYVTASAQCSLLLEFAVPFLDFLCVLLFFINYY